MTNLTNCLDSCSIYVGTYAKYNNGSIYGKWFNLTGYSDFNELIEAMKELHKDESDPEFMIQDLENCSFFEKMGFVGECYLSNQIFEIADQINDSGYDIEIFEACLDCLGKMDFSSLLDHINNNYFGQYNNDTDFVQELLGQSGDIPANIPSYICIDWETTARNIMFDYYESDGYYFRS